MDGPAYILTQMPNPAATLKLEVLNPAFKGKRFPFREGLRVGSDASCQIRAQHADLKPVHMRLILEDGRPMVEIGQDDARVYVNGKDVELCELRHNDLITAGPIRFKVIDEALASQSEMRLDALLKQADDGFDQEVYDFAKEDLFYRTTKDPALRTRISFVIPSRDKYLEQSQVFLARLVKNSGADEMQIDSFMTVAKELILNAHRHGHKYDESKKVIIRYRDSDGRLSLTVEDQGPGFDHVKILNAVRTKDAAQAARERYLAGGFGGLGFQLITKLVEDLSYNEAGNIATFSLLKSAPEGTL